MQKIAVALALLVSLGVGAMADEKKAKIGFLSWQPSSAVEQLNDFRTGLHDFGYIEGANIEIEAHFVDGNRDLAREIASRFVREAVDVIVALPTPAIHIVKDATRTIPIVMGSVADPIATGLVESLARPGGNITGVTTMSPGLTGKRLELLREIRPDIRNIGFLGLRNDQNLETFLRETQAAADQLGVGLVQRLVDNLGAIDEMLFADLQRHGVEAVIIQPIFIGRQEQIVRLALRSSLPVVADRPIWGKAGALLSYGPDTTAQFQRAAYYVDRILKGAKPADLPVEQPTKFTLVINLNTAKALGLAVPQALLARADELIE